MEILTVCGMGFGTSLMLKMTVDDILKEEGIKASVDAVDASSAKGSSADLIMASSDLKATLEGLDNPTVYIDNLIDNDEIKEKLLKKLKEMDV